MQDGPFYIFLSFSNISHLVFHLFKVSGQLQPLQNNILKNFIYIVMYLTSDSVYFEDQDNWRALESDL